MAEPTSERHARSNGDLGHDQQCPDIEKVQLGLDLNNDSGGMVGVQTHDGDTGKAADDDDDGDGQRPIEAAAAGSGPDVPGGETQPPRKPRQWLIDRMFGKSPPPESKPPYWICYVPPCLSLAPDIFEQNCFCECLGGIGVVSPDEKGIKGRRLLMQLSIFVNFVGIVLTVTSCFSISTKFDILRRMSFSSGTIRTTDLESGQVLREGVTTDIGLRAVAYSDPFLGQRVLEFDEFCDYRGPYGALQGRFIRQTDCNSCADVSVSLVFTLIMSAFPLLPSIATSVIRMYYNYDINCLKAFSTLVAGSSMVLSLYTFLAYRFQCFLTFFEGDVYFSANGTVVDSHSDEAAIVGTVHWSPGNGLICILVATSLVGLDVILHLLLPSPTMARDHEMQEEYERRKANSGVSYQASPRAFVESFINMIRRK